LNTGAATRELRDAECRDTGVTDCGVLLAAQNQRLHTEARHYTHQYTAWRVGSRVSSIECDKHRQLQYM